MIVDKIENHVQEARDRLISQYKEAPNLTAILDAFITQIQDLENASHSLYLGRWIDEAVGQTLDDFGTIVGQERLGFDDAFYKILLYAKIGENVSQGETVRVVDVYKIITRANRAELQEHFPGGMILLSDGTINPITASFILQRLQRVVGAGIRVDRIGQFSKTNPFGFVGAPGAQGFADITQTSGGEFAFFYDTALPFSFFNPNRNDVAGLGTLKDHIFGGKFQSVT